ncbi:MAG: HAMP domain-containing protein [Bryobacteraceae bacterium]|nr:HAMP domain-containing protein [Bryobacteraceae bacterium]
MSTLFTRTLLWFIATVVLTLIAMTVAAALNMDPGDRHRPPFATLVAVEMEEARHAYETGGSLALKAFLERLRSVTDSEGVLTDSNGVDLATGQFRADLEPARRAPRKMFWRGSRTSVSRQSEDGRYFYFIELRRRNVLRWVLQPEVHLTVLGLLTVLSYAFAHFLTSPVRQLQSAVECFGRGEFDTRMKSLRKDEIGQLARAFDTMADRIETLLAAERRLLLDISHELRSPLTRLNLAVELARSGDDVPRHLDRIDREAERLNALVGELLQVTRAEGDGALMRGENVPLDWLVARVVEDARIEAEERGCRIEIKESSGADLRGDPELLRRAIENVVRNAVRYTDPDTSVEVRLTTEAKEAILTVRDYGPGVPAGQLDQIFDPFYRVDPDRNRVSGGAGLGLAIARRAIQLHRGSITATNADPGLIVGIRLPIGLA